MLLRWHGASYDGGGIADGSAKAYASQFRAPSSGMVYTPPKLSDHIGVSLLLKGRPALGLALDVADAKTRACQPQRQQRRISDMFSKRGAAPAEPMPPNASARSGAGGGGRDGGGSGSAAWPPPRKRQKAAPKKGDFIYVFYVTFCANPAHNLTCSPSSFSLKKRSKKAASRRCSRGARRDAYLYAEVNRKDFVYTTDH